MTDKIIEILQRELQLDMPNPEEAERKVAADITVLISEHYTEKEKYDDLLRKRDELIARCYNLEKMLWEIEKAHEE